MLVVAAILIVALGAGSTTTPVATGAQPIVITATPSATAAASAAATQALTQATEPSPTAATLLPTATATELPLTPTAIVVVVTPTAEPTQEPTATLPPTSTPPPTATSEPSPTPPAAAATATPDTVSTAPPAAPTAAPPPSTASGRIAFAVIEGDKYVLYSISAAGGDRRWLGDYLRQPSYRQDGAALVANGEGAA